MKKIEIFGWTELKNKLGLSIFGNLLYYLGAIKPGENINAFNEVWYKPRLRILHPVAFIFFIVMVILSIPGSIFVNESLMEIWKYQFKEITWW